MYRLSVYFFFDLNTAHLTDSLQKVNLDALAHVAKKYGLSVKVAGAADSATGTASINNALSTARADYIAGELIKRGFRQKALPEHMRAAYRIMCRTKPTDTRKVELYFR